KLITKRRHFNILIIFTTQYIKELPPLIRSCTNYFITFFQTDFDSIKSSYEIFMRDFNNCKDCQKFIEKYCQEYSFIITKMKERRDTKYIVTQCPYPQKYQKIEF